MKNLFQKTKLYVKSHKIMSIIVLVVILLLGYFIYSKITNTGSQNRYVLSAATKNTIISSVAGSGQVASSDSIDITAKVSGNVTYVGVAAGDQVKKGKLLLSIDSTDAEKAVRDAETNLQSAQLALQTAQAQNGNTDTNQQTTINNAYNALLNSNLEAVPDNSNSNDKTANSLSTPTISGNYTLGKEGVINLYFYSSNGGISFQASGLANGGAIASSSFASPIGNSGLFLTLPNNNDSIAGTDWIINIPNKSASNYLSNYNSYQAALQTQSETSSNSNLGQLDIQSQQLAVTKAENALQDAKDTLADYSILAPFDGTVASVPVQVGDISSGTLLTIIANNNVAIISLNEVDVAKIALGQKVNLTFDAIPDLSISGKVAEIDSVGTVSQGVVNYNVKISFDTNDTRVKPGMSANAEIITNVEQDALTVPNSAIKTQNGVSYVQMFTTALPTPATGVQGSVSATPPINQVVTAGVSDDTNTEILSGLKEGDEVVTKTIAGTATTTASTTPSLFSSVSGRGGAAAGGATRAVRGN
jgi:HlyD family secretion protein